VSFTTATSGLANWVLTVAVWPEPDTTAMDDAAAAVTETVAVPLAVVVDLSATVIVCEPAVFKVTPNVNA
jgi:hypothetical protein